MFSFLCKAKIWICDDLTKSFWHKSHLLASMWYFELRFQIIINLLIDCRFLLPASLIVINDIAAYLCGFFFGKTPLIKLSPKKTWEGFIGASIATIISAFLVHTILLEVSTTIYLFDVLGFVKLLITFKSLT